MICSHACWCQYCPGSAEPGLCGAWALQIHRAPQTLQIHRFHGSTDSADPQAPRIHNSTIQLFYIKIIMSTENHPTLMNANGKNPGPKLGGVGRAKKSETAHWWGMCWDTWAQRRNRSASPLRDAAVPQSLREILFTWVPCHRKRSQGHSVFTSGVPNMSGTRLTCKKINRRWHIFQLGTPWGWWPRPPWKNFNWAPRRPTMS